MPNGAPTSPELWILAICAMRDQGIGESSARAFLGLCLKSWDEATVRAAVLSALGKADFKAYCKAILSGKPPRRPAPDPQASLLEPRVDPARAREAYAAHRERLFRAIKR